MQFYSKAALQLIYDQANRDNPKLPVPLSASNAALTKTPVVVSTSTYGRNTRVEFTAYPGSGLQGRITVYYDRIDLSQLISFNPTVYMKPGVATQQDMLAYLNNALGITLSASDLATPTATVAAPNAASQTITMAISAASPAYTGNLVIRYQLKSTGNYPNSGPGPKTLLVGDQLAGYFGVVNTNDLFTHSELIRLAFLKGTFPTLYSGPEGWYKFFFNSKIIYLPVSPVGSNVTWNTLYNEGLVYGTDDNGKYPSSPAVNQLRILGRDTAAEGRFYYRIRLPVCGADPFTTATGSISASEYNGSEVQMFNYLYNGKWSSLTNTAWSLWCMFQNSVSSNPTATFKMATLALQSWTTTLRTTPSSSYYWFPVLELVDTSTTLLGLDDVTGRLDMSLKTIPFDIDQTFQLKPLQPGNPKTADFLPVPFDVDQSLYLQPLNPGAPKTIDFRPIPFKAEIYTSSKVDLSTTNGDLEDF